MSSLITFENSAIAQSSKPTTNKKPQSSTVTKTTMTRNPTGVTDSQKALEVKGQARNLSMMLVLKNRADNIDFVKPRQNYQNEIKSTGF